MTDINIYSALGSAPHYLVPGTAGDALAGARQADVVGINDNGEMVPADAAAGSAQHAVGVLFPERVTDMSQIPGGDDYTAIRHQRGSTDALPGDRVTAIKHGVIVINPDEDWGFTGGEPVYLGEGGGLTQTQPSDAGDIQQTLGFCVDIDRVPVGEAVWIDVANDYTTA